MAVARPDANGGARQAPGFDARQPPHSAPKSPMDNTAATKTPKETRIAVNSTFGGMPKTLYLVNVDPPPLAQNGDTDRLPGGTPVAVDANGNAYMALPDGKYAVTEGGHAVVYDNANAGKPVAIDPATGEAVKDPAGNILAIGENGNFIRTADGNNVVYTRTGNKYNLTSTDKDGNPMVVHGYPAAVDANGNYLHTPNGYAVVIEKMGNPVAVDQEGKQLVINDYPAAVGKDGNFLPNVVYDKATGFRAMIVNGRIRQNPDGRIMAVDENGKEIRGENGLPAVYDPRGVPVQPTGKTTSATGAEIVKDVTTGEQVGLVNGYVFKLDPKTGELAKDADRKLLPPIYDPVNSDVTRPPIRPNQDAATTLKNLPQGTERGDPMKIKDELFDVYGNLDADMLRNAAGRYDPRDVYDALINASQFGGWDKLPKSTGFFGMRAGIVHPNEAQSRDVIATLIAWQNMNGKYAPIRKGQVPPIMLYEKETGGAVGAFEGGVIFARLDDSVPATLFHELNHSKSANAFEQIYREPPSRGVSAHEVVTEYIASRWTGNSGDPAYEDDAAGEFKRLDEAVKVLGDGDANKGMDILQRAYFAGDLQALEKLRAVYRPK